MALKFGFTDNNEVLLCTILGSMGVTTIEKLQLEKQDCFQKNKQIIKIVNIFVFRSSNQGKQLSDKYESLNRS